MTRFKTVRCPSCGHRSLATIVYGLVSLDDVADEKVVFGGCCVSDDDPIRECVDCGAQVWDDGRVAQPTDRSD